MASIASLFFYYSFLLLSLFLLCNCSHVDGGEAQGYHVISVVSLLPDAVCSSSKGSDPTRLRIVHRHGPCAPLNHLRKLPPPLSHGKLLLQDQFRVDSLHHRITTASKRENSNTNSLTESTSTIPAHLGSSLGISNYIVTVGLGTPKRDLSLVFDTGSDLTWTQCKPCVKSCYSQQEPIFDPAESSTYKNISCNSDECTQLSSSTSATPQCSASTCVYGIQYGDSSFSVGFFAQDTLTLTASDTIPSFRFGCGENNRGLFGQTAGLLGLGRDSVSVVSQGSQKHGGVFSYCLPKTSSSTGYLTFGGSATTATVKLTPMLTDNPSFYFLDLTGIIVGGRKLSIPPTVFSNAGTIIDSGTVITRLPPAAYSTLRSAFRRAMSKYPSAPALSILDTCYNLTGYNTVRVPTVALQFHGGVTVDVDFSGILYVVSVSQACLAFAGNGDAGDTAIIGNVQQRTIEVVYDVSKKVIGFGPGGCS